MVFLDRLYWLALTVFVWLRHPKKVIYFIRRTRRLPDVVFPKTVNEKFLWRKLFDHDPRFVVLSDKLACKEWVTERVPELAVAKVHWVGKSLDFMPTGILQQDVVLKANHGCGTNLFLAREPLSEEELKNTVNGWLNYDHGKEHGEWAYSQVDRQLFVEQTIHPVKGEALSELKILTFGGRVTRIVHIAGRFGEIRANAWEENDTGELVLSKERAFLATGDPSLVLPGDIDYALSLARLLGAEFDHLRVDFLYDGETWWFGELTVYNQAGYMYIPSASDPDSLLSRAWDLQRAWFLQTHHDSLLMRWYASALRRYLLRASLS